MIKIQINGHEDISFFVDTPEEAAEFVHFFQTKNDGIPDLRGMSTTNAAVTLLKQNGKEMTSAQIAYELVRLGVRFSSKSLPQNISDGLKRRMKHPNSRIEKSGRFWKFKTSEEANELLPSA